MPQFQWALMCRNIIPEPELGGYTLNAVFDTFFADKYPAIFGEDRYLISKWFGEPDEEFTQIIESEPLR